MAGTTRPRPSQRVMEGIARLRNNTDFIAFREHLEAELAYVQDQLVNEADPHAFGQLQGRARQLQDQLKYINRPEG